MWPVVLFVGGVIIDLFVTRFSEQALKEHLGDPFSIFGKYENHVFGTFMFVLCFGLVLAVQTKETSDNCGKYVTLVSATFNDDNLKYVDAMRNTTNVCSLASSLKGWKEEFEKKFQEQIEKDEKQTLDWNTFFQFRLTSLLKRHLDLTII